MSPFNTGDLPLLGRFPLQPLRESGIFSDLHVSCVQHVMGELVGMVSALLQLGIRPTAIDVMGKPYSTSIRAAELLKSEGVNVFEWNETWQRGEFERYFETAVGHFVSRFQTSSARVILDDGGYLLRKIASQSSNNTFGGIEQTSSGLERFNDTNATPSIPIVAVANSAVKRLLEPLFILRATLLRLERSIGALERFKNIAIIGLGNLGETFSYQLAKMGYKVFVYDSAVERALKVSSLHRSISCCEHVWEAVNNANIVFGCTGRDVLPPDTWHRLIAGERILASCSSGDNEFRSILRAHSTATKLHGVFRDMTYSIASARLTVLAGGFPVNFSRDWQSVPLSEIQLTRALLLGGIIQTVLNTSVGSIPGGVQMLHPRIQRFVAQEWFKLNSTRIDDYTEETKYIFEREDSIRAISGGQFFECSAIARFF